MPHSRIPVRSRVLLACCLGLGMLGMAVLGLLLVPAEHARAAQASVDSGSTQYAAQGGPNLDALRRQMREYARQRQGNAAPLTAAPSASPDQAGAITGRLVAGNTGVANAPLILRRYRPADNLGDAAVMTATTSTTGTFVFANPPTPETGYAYYVEFGPQTSNPNLAYLWDSDDIATYIAGQSSSVGTLDVANVPLVAPANNATVSFPVTFEWTPRARTTDNYVVFREDLSGNFTALSSPLGHVDRYLATSAGGARLGEPYLWGIFIDNTTDNGSFGLSQRRTITFTDSPVQVTSTTTPTLQTTVTPTVPATGTTQATGTPTATGTPGTCLSGTVQINIQNFAFVPQTVTVCQGATVRWTNLDTISHTSTSDTGVWDSGLLGTGQSFSFTFNTTGSFPYHCTPHPGMRGTINVVAAPAATETATPTPTAGATGTATVMLTGTATVQATGTATVQATGTATTQATGTATAQATGTATVQTTGTPTATGTPGTCQSGTVQINIQNFAFVPQTVTVCQGATVRWTNLDTAPHTSTSDTNVWDSGVLNTGQSFSFTFNATGSYPYHCEIHPGMRGTINVVAAPSATGTPTAGATGTGTPEVTGTPTVSATGTATAEVTGTPTVMLTGTVQATGTATAQATGTATAQATGTATAQATGTATAQATGTATAQATGTATLAPTGTATLPATGTPTATVTATAQATRTATVQPTVTATAIPPVTCGGGNLCAGVVVVRAFIDFGCDGFFNRGTDYPLYGATVTATLPDGTRLVSIVDENGNAVISGINLAATGSIQVSIDSPPLPTWVQQASLGLAPCGTSPTTITLQRSNFGLFGVAFTDFRFGLTQP